MSLTLRGLSLALSIAVLALFALPEAARAGTLEKIRHVKVQVGKLDANHEACGLTRDAITEAFLAPVRKAGPTVTESSAYFLFVRVTSVPYIEETCVSYADVALLLTERYFNPATGGEKTGLVRLWSAGSLHSSGTPEHAGASGRALGRLGDQVADAWRRDQ